MTRRLLFFAACSAFGQPAAFAPFIEETLKAFDVPGAAVLVLKDGQPVLRQGFGVRNLRTGAKVDEHTLFGIASNTKAFTTAALAILADEGKLAWDDPVTKHLPDFALWDPYATREITVRDLVTHRSGLGLGAGDLLFWPDTTVTRAEAIRRVRWIPPASSFRSRYAYNNLLFLVAGEVVARVSGLDYDEFIRRRIFTPLGMAETRMSNRGLGDDHNWARPHSRGWRLEGKLEPIEATRDDVWAAAAGVKSNVFDLEKWLRVQLAGGVIEGSRRLFSERQAREMWASHTVVPVGRPRDSLKESQAQFAAYGLGWALRDYRGKKIVSHGGGLTGMVSLTTLVPDLNLAVLVLTNQEESGATAAITNRILDHYLGAPPKDWTNAYRDASLASRRDANAAEKKDSDARARNTKPSLDLPAYAREYKDRWYGAAMVSVDAGQLRLALVPTPSMMGRLEHWHYDTFIARWDDPTIPDAYVTFSLNEDGKVSGFKMKAISSLADFSFDFHDLDFKP